MVWTSGKIGCIAGDFPIGSLGFDVWCDMLNTYMNTIPHKLIFFRRESPARKWMDQCVTFIPVITLKGLEKQNIRTSL